MGRFINGDDVEYIGANRDFTSLNLFAYCGNNPVARVDSGGNLWIFTAAAKVGIGVLTQYAGDVLGNIASGAKGVEIFQPTSTVGEYVAAGVTALIPGTGATGAFVRNIVTEGIKIVENTIKGKEVNIWTSGVNVLLGTALDTGFERVLDKTAKLIRNKMPQNYSSYAHTARKSNPNLTREQVYRSMQRSIRTNRIASKVVSTGFDIIRASLPY